MFLESLKPPGKGQNRKTSPPKVEDVNVNLNRCDTFKDKMEMGSKHLDGGLISKPSVSLNQLCTILVYLTLINSFTSYVYYTLNPILLQQ